MIDPRLETGAEMAIYLPTYLSLQRPDVYAYMRGGGLAGRIELAENLARKPTRHLLDGWTSRPMLCCEPNYTAHHITHWRWHSRRDPHMFPFTHHPTGHRERDDITLLFMSIDRPDRKILQHANHTRPYGHHHHHQLVVPVLYEPISP